MIPRLHLLEIHEQPWCPRLIRDGATDCLQVVASVCQQYRHIVPKLHGALQATGSRRIIDLCSGGGGPWLRLLQQLNRLNDRPVEVWLTDLYPNESLHHRCIPHVHVERQPVDATRVPPSLQGFRTMFTAFHHFEPAVARTILQDAVSQRQGIAIFEQTRRHPLALPVLLAIPLIAWLATPLVRPWRWWRCLWTYLIPVIPTVLCFDGLVSCLRTYSIAEMRAMVATLDAPDYVWDIGRVPCPLSPLGITYLIGYAASDRDPCTF